MVAIKKRKKLTLIITVVVSLVVISGFSFWKSNTVTKINYNQTYTFGNKHDGPFSYIKFLDDSHYVAIPRLRLENDYNEPFGIFFIQGVYSRKKEAYLLGKNVKITDLWFDNYQDFESGKYTLQSYHKKDKYKFMPYVSGCIKKKRILLYYNRTIKVYNPEKKETYQSEIVSLKKAKLSLPNTEKEFIQRYHKKQGHQQE